MVTQRRSIALALVLINVVMANALGSREPATSTLKLGEVEA